MKICLLGYYENSFVNGSATLKVQTNIHRQLNKYGHETHLFVFVESKSLYDRLFDRLVFRETQNGIQIEGGLIPFIVHLMKHHYDVLHFIITRGYMMIVVLFSWFIKPRSIATFHDCIIFPRLINYNFNNIKTFILKYFLCKICDQILVYNEFDKKKIETTYPNIKTLLVRNGVDEKYFNENNASEKILCYAGGFDYTFKGYEFLLSALEKVACNYKLFLCGHGKPHEYMESYRGVLAEVDLIKQYRKSWIVVIPSSYDSFSMIGIEALACGTPIIITRSCGLSRYLSDGEGCYIIDYNDENALSEKISTILENDQLRNQLSIQASSVAGKFKWEEIISEYIDIYIRN